jgi:hypothetical protein
MHRLLRRITEGSNVPFWLHWRIYNVWPSLRGTGGRVVHATKDWTELDVRLPLNWRTRNYMGSIFGGSIYAAIDPYVMMMLIHQLGDVYLVWDKSARISFKRPGTETLYAKFRLPLDLVADLKAEVDEKNKIDYTYSLDLKDASGATYATVDKLVFIARKDWYEARQARRAARPSA